MYIDSFDLLLIILLSVVSGWIAYLVQIPDDIEEVEETTLGEYFRSPVYSQGVLDFYRRAIQEWVVIQFRGWRNVHNMNFSNRDHFKKLTAQILYDFFEDYSMHENVQFDYCLFTEEYLIQYISMMATETMKKLVNNEIQSMEEIQ